MPKVVLEVNEEDIRWSQVKGMCDLMEVYDKDSNIRTGEEVVKVWREHC